MAPALPYGKAVKPSPDCRDARGESADKIVPRYPECRSTPDGKRFGLTFEWVWDDDADLSWMEPEVRAEEHEVLGCIVRTPDNRVVASLWGIVDPDANYRRVVEAELAQEALATVEHR